MVRKILSNEINSSNDLKKGRRPYRYLGDILFWQQKRPRPREGMLLRLFEGQQVYQSVWNGVRGEGSLRSNTQDQ